MNGRGGTTTILPLDSRIGGQGICIHPTVRQFLTREQTRINPNYVLMSRLRLELKVCYAYILCIIDEVTSYLVTVCIFQARSEVGEALIENFIMKYCIQST